MAIESAPIAWDKATQSDCRELVRLALREDLGDAGDVTTAAVVDASRRGAARVVARQSGVAAGIGCVAIVLEEFAADVAFTPSLSDGAFFESGADLGGLAGAAADILRCERTILNLLGRLSGVATLTRRYAQAAADGPGAVYDTRKTTPGWRRLEKHAVRCGGGRNHRVGLFDAVLIKDNHLALADEAGRDPADAVRRARAASPDLTIEVEVDTLEQLRNVLPARPDIVLLDNMGPERLVDAVAIRDRDAPSVQLEASGGVRLETIGAIASTGVERISVGALTHQATSLDLGLDWSPAAGGL